MASPRKPLRLVERMTGNGSSRHEWPPDQQGDEYVAPAAYEGDQSLGDLPGTSASKTAPPKFPETIVCSKLRKASSDGTAWLWHGCIAGGAITLFSALPKAGKTTILAHLLRAFAAGNSFCGQEVARAQVLYVTEESESRWAERRDQLALGDHCRFLVRPFMLQSAPGDWLEFIDHLAEVLAGEPADLVVFDTLVNLWPVRDENDAAQVQRALMPLRKLLAACPCAVLLVHHLRKSDGREGTAARGSGAITGFVDVVLEMRRYCPESTDDRRRSLRGISRWDDTPTEVVVELLADCSGYKAHGSRQEVVRRELRDTIIGLLPGEPPGRTADEIAEVWPEETKPQNQKLRAELGRGVDLNDWRREGAGLKGDPYRFWLPPPV